MSIDKQWPLKANSRPSLFFRVPEQYAKAMNAATQADMFLRQVKRHPPPKGINYIHESDKFSETPPM
jgi:hypothetical protein